MFVVAFGGVVIAADQFADIVWQMLTLGCSRAHYKRKYPARAGAVSRSNDLAEYIPQFARGHVLKPLTAAVEFFVQLDDGFPHRLVSIFRSSKKDEVVPPRQACVAVGRVQP